MLLRILKKVYEKIELGKGRILTPCIVITRVLTKIIGHLGRTLAQPRQAVWLEVEY